MALVIMVVMTVVMMMVAVIMMMMQQPLRADLGHDDPRLVAWSSSTRPGPASSLFMPLRFPSLYAPPLLVHQCQCGLRSPALT